jgi:hypothetical protein
VQRAGIGWSFVSQMKASPVSGAHAIVWATDSATPSESLSNVAANWGAETTVGTALNRRARSVAPVNGSVVRWSSVTSSHQAGIEVSSRAEASYSP